MEAITMKEGLLSRREFLEISRRAGLGALGLTVGGTFFLSGARGAEEPQGSAGLGEIHPEAREINWDSIVAKVLPEEGYTLPIKWGNLGPTLVEVGVIDLGKLKQIYGTKGVARSDLRRLEGPSDDFITITKENASFLVNVFWALGLANKQSLLEELAMSRLQTELMRLASTGGWILGTMPAAEFYSNFEIIQLTKRQEKLVSDLAKSIYRPCCNNPTAFPDCNHGIALLGLIELMAANRFSPEDIHKASLKFNSFWFPRHYMKTALLFHLRGIDWDRVDSREILSFRYSSLGGWRQYVDAELQKGGFRLPPQLGGAGCQVSSRGKL